MTLPRLTFEQAKRAENAGFDWPTNANYSMPNGIFYPTELYAKYTKKDWNIAAPENALFLQWAREVKGLYGFVEPYFHKDDEIKYQYGIGPVKFGFDWNFGFDSHPEAETALINEILTILEK